MVGLWPQMAVVPWNLRVSDWAVRRGRPDRLPPRGRASPRWLAFAQRSLNELQRRHHDA